MIGWKETDGRSRLRFQQLERGRDNCDAGSPIRWLYHNPRSVDVSKFARVFKITTNNENPELITLNLCGRFTGEYVPVVEKELSRTGTRRKKLVLDLAEVTFVDRAAMAFLCAVRSKKIAIQNAPLYVGLWMEQEDRKGPLHSD